MRWNLLRHSLQYAFNLPRPALSKNSDVPGYSCPHFEHLFILHLALKSFTGLVPEDRPGRRSVYFVGVGQPLECGNQTKIALMAFRITSTCVIPIALMSCAI